VSSHFAIDVPASLIERGAGGDMRAFEQIYRLFERPVYTLALRLLGDAEEAEEILHDAMLQLFRKLGQFRGDAPFWGWLRQIAVNEALMRLRRRGVVETVDEMPEPADDAAASPEHQRDLERALARLPEITRSVVWLYHVEGYSHEEIATSFGKSVSFSKSQLARGTRKLRDYYDAPQAQVAYA
jgi:RNA polymerase sigma-70 factor (ECF subfamily)